MLPGTKKRRSSPQASGMMKAGKREVVDSRQNRSRKFSSSRGSGQPPSDFSALSRRVLTTALESRSVRDYLDEVTRDLVKYTGVDKAEVWALSQAGGYRYASVRRGSKRESELVSATPLPWDGNESGTELEQLCRDLLAGRITIPGWEPTRGKALRILLRSGLLPSGSTEPGVGDRKYDLAGVAGSLLLIMLRSEDQKASIDRCLVMLQSCRDDYFSKSKAAQLDQVAEHLALALFGRRSDASLRERVKELTCLYQISLLVEQPRASQEDILQGIVEVLPTAWLHPESAWARLRVDERLYQSGRVTDKGESLSADITVAGTVRGTLEVGYSTTMARLDEGPFLREERNLLETVSRTVALLIERKDIEEKSRRLQEQLIHAERLATIGEMSAGIAHELNEPLNTILGFAQLARKSPDLPAQTGQDLDKIITSALHTRQIIQQLLLFARRMPQRRTELNLNRVVEEALSLLRTLCTKFNVDLSCRLGEGLPTISADADQLRQVLVNLVVNGAQAMPSGGNLTITTRRAENGGVCLVVEDTGIGIAKSVLDRIFLPFWTTRSEGTGLGLSVVHGIVTSHGGTIRVESKPGKGSRFEVWLPRAAEGGSDAS